VVDSLRLQHLFAEASIVLICWVSRHYH